MQEHCVETAVTGPGKWPLYGWDKSFKEAITDDAKDRLIVAINLKNKHPKIALARILMIQTWGTLATKSADVKTSAPLWKMSCKIFFASPWTCPSCQCSVITRERLVNGKTSSPLGGAPNQLQECTPKSRQTKRRCGGPRSQQACCAACGCPHLISRRIRYRTPERIILRNAATSVVATFSFTRQGCVLVKLNHKITIGSRLSYSFN